MSLQEYQNKTLHLAACRLFGDSSADADASIVPELLSQAVLPLAMPDHKLSAPIIAQNMQIFYEHAELHELFTAHGIPYVTIKGCASAACYPEPVLRTMGDVDALVHPGDIARAGALLESIGFAPEGDPDGVHVGYHRGDSVWELHRSVNGIPENPAGELIRGYLSDIIETAADFDTGCGTVRIPDEFHHGLVLLLHTATHLTSEGVGLRHLCDWAVFVSRFEGERFAAMFQDRLTACGLWRFARLLTLVCVRYLHLPEQPWAGEAPEEVLEELISDIMEGGNFGHKDEDRIRQIKYISNRGQRTVDGKPALLQAWDTLGEKAKLGGKSRLAVMAEYAGMVLSGKRRMDSRDTVEHAARRKRLYAQFRLFEGAEG